MEQQQPTMVSADELLSKMFADTTNPPAQEEKKEEETILPKLPTATEAVEKEEVTPAVEPVKNSTSFSNKIQTLLDTGFVENFAITVDGEEVFLSDLEINDEETYNTLLEQIKSEKDNKLKENYISKEGLDETTQKLIEIKKAGGDITEIIKENVQAIDNLSNLKNIFEEGEDKDKEQVAINILVEDLRQKGLEDEVIEAQLRVYINKGELEDRATKILDTHISLHKDEIELKRQEELGRLAKEKEDFKTFKKTLSQTYKDLAIPENFQKVLVENATKIDEYQISNTDKLYFDSRKNPELFAKINFFLNNPNEFEKWISGKKVVEAKKDIIKSSISINTSKTKAFDKKDLNTIEDMFEQARNK